MEFEVVNNNEVVARLPFRNEFMIPREEILAALAAPGSKDRKAQIFHLCRKYKVRNSQIQEFWTGIIHVMGRL